MVKIKLNSGQEYILDELIINVEKALNENSKKYVAFYENENSVRWFFADAIESFKVFENNDNEYSFLE